MINSNKEKVIMTIDPQSSRLFCSSASNTLSPGMIPEHSVQNFLLHWENTWNNFIH